jgi:hypothetical protein
MNTLRISGEARYLHEGHEVSLIIAGKTDLGFKAVVNENFWGILYHNEVFQPLREGQKLTGYIKKIREDNKIKCNDLGKSMLQYGFAHQGTLLPGKNCFLLAHSLVQKTALANLSQSVP